MTEQKPFKLTAADKEMARGDSVDLPFYERSKVVVVQTNSPELVYGDKRYVEGAAAGDFVATFGDERVLFKGPTGFLCQVIGFSRAFNEYLPNHGSFVTAHDEKPGDTQWLKVSQGVPKEGLYRVGGEGVLGNHVVEMVYSYLLIGKRGAVFAFYGTACPIGHDFANRAQRIVVKVDDEELRGCTLAQFQFTSYLDRKGDKRWYKPNVTRAAKFGEPNGPTLEQWRFAQKVRQAFKQGLDWVPQKGIDPPVPPPEIEAPRHGSVNVGSGPDAWDSPPAPDRYDGPDEGEIEF